MMIKFIAVLIICSIFPVLKNLSAESLMGNLKSGPHAVGFKVANEYDYSRAYKAKNNDSHNSDSNLSGRPIQIAIWYPANSEEANSKMPLKEYLYLYAVEERLGQPTEEEKKQSLREWSSFFSSQGGKDLDTDGIIEAQTTATKDAKGAQGIFPLIVYGAGGDGEAFENFVLFEYLASHGYIVVASPSVGMYSHKMTTNPFGLETQTRDMEFLIDYMHDFPSVDRDRLAAMGWSWGGLASMLLQMRNPNVDAVLSLDGSIAVHEDKARQSPFFDITNIRVPYMFMSARATLDELTNFYKKVKYSNAYLLDFHRLTHGDFSSYSYVVRNFISDSDDAELSIKRTSYELIAVYALHFFNAYLKENSESLRYLNNEIMKNDKIGDLLTIIVKESLPLPPSEDKFFELIREKGIEEAHGVYKEVKSRDPEYKLFEEWNLTELAFIFFNDLNKKEEAIEIMKLNIAEHPKSYKSYGYIARLYEKNKDWKNALVYFSMAYGMTLKQQDAGKKDIAWYKRRMEKLKEKL